MGDDSYGGITGTLTLLPLPHEGEPYVFGMAAAVASETGVIYFLQEEGKFYLSNDDAVTQLPPLGSKVIVNGRAAARQDSQALEFYTIEIEKITRITD